MASFEVTGFINTVKYLPDSVLLFVDEYRKGFKKKDGTRVDDKYLSWKVVYKPYFKKYISEHFSKGMLVKIKGEVLPYAVEHEKLIDGYSVIGQTIDLASYPRASVKQELRMIKESQENSDEQPNLDAFISPDF